MKIPEREKSNRISPNKQDAMARNLKGDAKAMSLFEKAYRKILSQDSVSDNFFEVNSRQASERARTDRKIADNYDAKQIEALMARIVGELVADTRTLHCDGCATQWNQPLTAVGEAKPVTREEMVGIPDALRPQLTGQLMAADIGGDISTPVLLSAYKDFLDETDPKKKEAKYWRFRQGLDILDIEPVMYDILSTNRNSMGYWLSAITKAAGQYGFFQIPKTIVAKVPMPLLQLTRIEYSELTPTTLKIVDDWAMQVFQLDPNKSYFIKTGTYSSKFDFRNCKVTSEKEVGELGEYLLYIHQQANQMAGPMTLPKPIIGASTTNEWVVREYIEDTENNPTIYKGLPLHTEYRVFVDFDNNSILGYTPYWHPEGMKQHFVSKAARDIHAKHDYVTFEAHKNILMQRYDDNINSVIKHIKELLPDVDLDGQWSIDIMQNGDDFWLIDMATADMSALSECVPAGLIKKQPGVALPADFEPLLTQIDTPHG